MVEARLRDDPAGVYSRQDFSTRDRYRQMVEKLSRGSQVEESAVADKAIGLAARPTLSPLPGAPGRGVGGEEISPQNHVGYYLVGDGRAELESQLRYRPAMRDWLLSFLLNHPQLAYFGGIASVVFILLAVLVTCLTFVPGTRGAGVAFLHPALAVLAVLAAALPASDIAVSLVNYWLGWLTPPRVLPKLLFKDGVPEDCATFVVMPTLLIRPRSAAVLLERLEVHSLANPDPRLRFALLTDFADAPSEHMPEDEAYLQAALDGVRSLNDRYCAGGPDRFFVFHRRRLWNPTQGCWMGWERKRGKLMEFNRLLRGAT